MRAAGKSSEHIWTTAFAGYDCSNGRRVDHTTQRHSLRHQVLHVLQPTREASSAWYMSLNSLTRSPVGS